jgi:hypothetical protein
MTRNASECRATINFRGYDYYKLAKMMYWTAYVTKLKFIILEG